MSKSSKSSRKTQISNIKYPYAKSWDLSKKHVTFEIQKNRLALINSLRRSTISDVKTFAARALPYKSSTIQIVKNDTSLTNQMIAHRISLIPINITDEKFPIDDYEFYIDVSNNENKFKTVTTNDIQVLDIKKGTNLSKEDTLKIFPKDPKLNTDIVITKIKPVYTNNSNVFDNFNNMISNELKFYVKFKAVLSSGSEDACFNPHSVVSCSFKEDPKLVEEGRQEYIKNETQKFKDNNLQPLTKEELTKIFDTSFKERFYYKDENEEPTHFIYKIESIGNIPPLIIFHRSINALINRINNFEINIKTENANIITVQPSKNMLEGFIFTIQNESDTLGNLIQDEIYNSFSDSENEEDNIVSFISYKRIHPLEEKIIFNILSPKFKEPNQIINNIFVPTCETLIKKLKSLQNNLEETKEYISELKTMHKNSYNV
tara:strand:- start:1130 stop:2425 length:1296 start_codon:yes stop_codon:yes gene_type:complete